MQIRFFALVAACAMLSACDTLDLSPDQTTPAPAPVAPPPPNGGTFAVALPVIPDRMFKLTDFGAMPDGQTLNTEAFRRAIAAVNAAGGGTLVVPAGNYLTGPIDLCSSLNFHLESGARILFSQNRNLYRIEGSKYRPLIQASDCHDLMFSGPGAMDGQGQPWWADERKVKSEARASGLDNGEVGRPFMLVLTHCQRVCLKEITLTNSPKFHFLPVGCTDVMVDGINIVAPANSPNTDGIDPAVCQRVIITHCRIDTGDDCIAVKAGQPGYGPVSDVLVTDCTFLHGHGCSIGSETNAGVHNMIVRNCTFDGTDLGVRLKSDRSRGGVVENVTYTDLTMKNVGQAIVIVSYYPDHAIPKLGHHDAAQPVVNGRTPIWRNITIRNITATAGTKSAGLIMGLPEMPASNITLENISIGAPAGLRIGYAKGVSLHNVHITSANGGPPLLIEDTATDVKQD